MFCIKCGYEIPDDSVYCHNCGNPVENTTMHESDIITRNNRTFEENPYIAKKQSRLSVVFAAIIILVLILAGFFYYSKQKDILNNKEKLNIITASCLRIECYDYAGGLNTTGSGFIAFSDDLVVTNYHVIEEHPFSIKAVSENGQEYSIDKIIVYNQDVDIAVLQIQGHTGLSPLTLSPKPVEKTDRVVAVGSPLGLINVVSEGIVSGFTEIDNVHVIQFTASISHGSSGGVLLNHVGDVVGVTCATFQDGQNMNLAIPIDYVEALFQQRASFEPVVLNDINRYVSGLYIATRAEQNGIHYDIDEIYDGGFSLQLKTDGYAVLTMGRENYSLMWSLDGESVRLTAADSEYKGTLSNGILILHDILDTGIDFVFIRES